jgi:tetratricopeptide (TPR) repeat protein
MSEPFSPFFTLGGDENLQRGIILRLQHRYADAQTYLAKAIEVRPDLAAAHFQMALCYIDWGKHEKQALIYIDRAIALNPREASFFAAKAVLMGNMNKHGEAMRLADEALALDSENINGLNVKTRSFSAKAKWREMEASARRTLEIEPGDEVATNFLALALRQQGRREEGDKITAELLARTPENAWAQTNAGWSALEAGNYRQANSYFLCALRLEPDYEDAREGLLHSINSRLVLYRIYVRINSLYNRFDVTTRVGIVALWCILYHYTSRYLHHTLGHVGGEIMWFLMIVYFTVFACGREFGNFFLLLHPFGRHALSRDDKIWAWVTFLGYLWLLRLSFQLHVWTGIVFLPLIGICFLVSVLISAKESHL